MRSIFTDDIRDCGHHLISNHQQCPFDQLLCWQSLSICEALRGCGTNVITVTLKKKRGKKTTINLLEKKCSGLWMFCVLYMCLLNLLWKKKKNTFHWSFLVPRLPTLTFYHRLVTTLTSYHRLVTAGSNFNIVHNHSFITNNPPPPPTYPHTHACMHTCMHTCMPTPTSTHTHTHTHTHTNTH